MDAATAIETLQMVQDEAAEDLCRAIGTDNAPDKKSCTRLVGRAYHESVYNATEKAMKLLQAEDEGRLVILPCKVGDTVYRVDSWCSSFLSKCDGKCKSCPKKKLAVFTQEVKTTRDAFDFVKSWGHTVFATKEKAERALETMRMASKAMQQKGTGEKGEEVV